MRYGREELRELELRVLMICTILRWGLPRYLYQWLERGIIEHFIIGTRLLTFLLQVLNYIPLGAKLYCIHCQKSLHLIIHEVSIA